MAKMARYSDKNLNLSLFLAFQRIKIASAQHKSNEKTLKSTVNLLQRLEKYKVKQAFGKLLLATARKDKNFIDNFNATRAANFGRRLSVLLKKRKETTFSKLVSWAKFVRSYSKLRVITVIRGRL